MNESVDGNSGEKISHEFYNTWNFIFTKYLLMTKEEKLAPLQGSLA